ncbi:LLM class flavin-dependent oxidoreductase [Actinokineospora sp.]|uniref:LLM class flavin-dependent oxidoreductase n=1 Tax=Actinokineospora sp. TaxID=1872133 RepID=UPI00403765AE
MTDLLIGLGITTSADEDPVAEAIAAEALGYDFVSASDHPVGAHASYETLSLLTWIAAHTSRIKVATRVLGAPFRRPAMLAKAAESLSRLSGGRLILGLGAGHSDDEIRALGGPALTPRDKIDGLAETIRILRGAWTHPSYNQQGRIHTVDDLTLEPKPATPIPVWLGTFGPRALAVTGRLADGWIPSLGFAPPARIPDMLDRVRTAAATANRPADAVRPIYNVAVHVDATAARTDDMVTGSPTDVLDQLRAFTELGFTGFNIVPETPDDVRAFAEEVLPALR